MLSNNQERLKVVLSMSDPFDYAEFKKLCSVQGIEPLRISEYAQKIGMLMVGKRLHPDLSDAESYMALIAEMNAVTTIPGDSSMPGEATQNRSCGGCGGGRIR